MFEMLSVIIVALIICNISLVVRVNYYKRIVQDCYTNLVNKRVAILPKNCKSIEIKDKNSLTVKKQALLEELTKAEDKLVHINKDSALYNVQDQYIQMLKNNIESIHQIEEQQYVAEIKERQAKLVDFSDELARELNSSQANAEHKEHKLSAKLELQNLNLLRRNKMEKISYNEYWQQSEDDWIYAHKSHEHCHFPCATCGRYGNCKQPYDLRSQEQLFNEQGHPIRGKCVIDYQPLW